jgi:beta-glucanase (GH16 family)
MSGRGHPLRRLGGIAAMTGVALTAALVGGSAMVIGASPAPAPVSDQAASPASAASPGAGWVLTWSDEFDGPAGSPPDPDTWGYDLGDGSDRGLVGWGNQERQWYTDDPANVALDGNGALVITVRAAGEDAPTCWYGPCEYTSARLTTKDRLSVTHGRVEARIRVPEGFGIWPAFWMLGDTLDTAGWPAAGEIDVMEHVGRQPTLVHGTLHGPGYSGSSGPTGTIDLGAPVADEAHTVAIEWGPGTIAWSVDGVEYHRVSAADVAPSPWVFDRPFHLLLNVAVGGAFGGPVDPALELPQEMIVEYVRVYEAVP